MSDTRVGRASDLFGEGSVRIAPRASAIPGFATARLLKYIFHSTTTSCARTSTSWNHFRKALERPGVTKPLPTQYKPAEAAPQIATGEERVIYMGPPPAEPLTPADAAPEAAAQITTGGEPVIYMGPPPSQPSTPADAAPEAAAQITTGGEA